MKLIRRNFIFTLILFLGLLLRFYRLNIPILEFAPTRQVQTAEITRNLINDNYDFLHPRVVYEGPKRQLLLVEFPGYNIIVAFVSQILHLQLEPAGRIVSILSFIAATIFLYLIAKNIFGKFVAIAAVYFFTFSPLSILVSRSFIPDEMMVASSIGALYFLLIYTDQKKYRFLVLSILLSSWACLLKITAVFLLLPIFITLKSRGFNKKIFLIYLVSLLPAVGWYLYASVASQSPRAVYIPGYSLIYRFKLNLFFEREYYSNIFGLFYNLILLPVGIVFFVFGLFTKIKNSSLFLYSWLVAIILYFMVFNLHTSTHEYYSLLALPLFCIFIGIGIENIVGKIKNLYIPRNLFLAVLFIIVTILLLPATLARAYSPIDRFEHVPEAGNAIMKLTKPSDLIIGSMDAGPSLVYYSHRTGWSFEVNRGKTLTQLNEIGIENPKIAGTIEDLENLRSKGAVIFASGNKNQLEGNTELLKYLHSNYKVLKETKDFIIFNLKK